jgi:glycerol-3-phosphate dehydrogenase (NAD(P)+)
MTEEVAVLGAGNMGTALAQVIASNGHHVRLWSIEHDVLEQIRDHHLNTKYLEDVGLHSNIEAVWDIAQAVDGARLVIISVPSQVVPRLSRDLAGIVEPGQLVLNVAKGLVADSHQRMSEAICAELGEACSQFVGSMGGPAIAIEMARGGPVAVTIGLRSEDGCRTVQSILQNDHVKVQTTDDLAGLELCATLKNVYAMCLGMCDGIGYGTNTKAFFASLSLDEMCDIATTLGGQRDTVYGLAGLGDLLTTGFSAHSRNRSFGEQLGAGRDWQRFLETNTVEGVIACSEVAELIEGRGLQTPLLDTIHDVVFDKRPAPDALRAFFSKFSYG